jgi:hypothetical protein
MDPDLIYREFAAVQGAAGQLAAADSLAGLLASSAVQNASMTELAASLVSLTAAGVAPAAGSGSSSSSTSTAGSGGSSSTLSDVGKYYEYSSGIGIAAVELYHLFGGGGTDAPLPLVKYAMPEVLNFQGSLGSGGAIAAGGYDQSGDLRSAAEPAAVTESAPGPGPGGDGGSFGSSFALPPAPASAASVADQVREALLYCHPLMDVIVDL